MNLLLLLLLAITALFLIRGYRRGLFKSAVSTIGIALAVFITAIIYPYVALLICNLTNVDDRIDASISDSLEELVPETPTRTEQMDIIDNLELNQTLKDMLMENNNDEIYDSLQVEAFTDYVSAYLTNVIVNGIAYVVTFIIMMLIVFILIHFADIFTDIPVVHAIDKVGGLVFGMAEALAFIWMLFLIITVLSTTEGGVALINMIEESPILKLLYDNNILLKIAIGLY